MSNWDHYRIKPLHLEDLEHFGVRQGTPCGAPTAHIDEDGVVMLNVGDVTKYADGRIVVWPRIGLEHNTTVIRALLTSAEDALLGKKLVWTMRRRKKGTYRILTVYMPAEEGNPLRLALRSALDVCDPTVESRAWHDSEVGR